MSEKTYCPGCGAKDSYVLTTRCKDCGRIDSIKDSNRITELEKQLADKDREIELLRFYGNKDCTAMADIEIAKLRDRKNIDKEGK